MAAKTAQNPRLQARAKASFVSKFNKRARSAGVKPSEMLCVAAEDFMDRHKTPKELFEACMARRLKEVA